MASGKGFATRRSDFNHYCKVLLDESDGESEHIELGENRKVHSASGDSGKDVLHDTSNRLNDVRDCGDNSVNDEREQQRPKPPVERRAERAEKTRSTGSAGSDHVDMAIKASKDVADKGYKRRMSEHRNQVYRFGWFDILVGFGSIIVYIIDISTDIKLAVDYFLDSEWFYGGVTTALIAGPSLVTCCFGLHWYIIDYKTEKLVIERSKKRQGHVVATPKGMWYCRFIFTLLQFGPVVRTVEYLYYGCKSRSKRVTDKEKRRYHWWMLYEDVDNCLLRLFESFLESAPQLTWQLYIFIKTKPTENALLTTTRIIALLSSWGSLAISLVSYHKSLRNSRDDKAKLGILSMPFYLLWRASETGARVLCIAMFASAFDFWVFGILLFHWAFISGWLMNQRTTFYKNKCLEKAFNVICGYVMMFCFLNLREGYTRYRYLVFYFVFYVENFFMLAFWFRFTPDLGAWFHIWGFISVLILFVLHVFFQLIFYTFFHPTQEIRYCLPCDRYTFYASVCYDVQPDVDDAVGRPSRRYTSQEMIQENVIPIEFNVEASGDDTNSHAKYASSRGRQPKPQATTHQERVRGPTGWGRENGKEVPSRYYIK